MKKHILLIDDEPAWLKLVSQLLTSEGYTVKGVATAVEALDLLAKFKPDLIVSDLRMPDMNGFDLLEKIKTLPRLSATPVVFLSAIDDFHAKKVAKELGAAGCITKPIERGDLLSSLKQFLPR
ncbi:MAG: response regulator [Bacteroidota bacterium]